MLVGARCGRQSDIYSFGIVLWEVCTGETPLRGDMRPIRVPEEAPQEVVDLFRACTAAAAAERPDTRQLIKTIEELEAPRLDGTTSGFAELQRSASQSKSPPDTRQ